MSIFNISDGYYLYDKHKTDNSLNKYNNSILLGKSKNSFCWDISILKPNIYRISVTIKWIHPQKQINSGDLLLSIYTIDKNIPIQIIKNNKTIKDNTNNTNNNTITFPYNNIESGNVTFCLKSNKDIMISEFIIEPIYFNKLTNKYTLKNDVDTEQPIKLFPKLAYTFASKTSVICLI